MEAYSRADSVDIVLWARSTLAETPRPHMGPSEIARRACPAKRVAVTDFKSPCDAIAKEKIVYRTTPFYCDNLSGG